MVHSKARVFCDELVEIRSQQDVFLGHVGKDEIHLRLVAALPASQNSTSDLQHGCDTGASSDHTKALDHVGGVDHCALWALDLHHIADVEGCHVLADVAGGVCLDEQVEVARLLVRGNGSVTAKHLFLLSDASLGVGDIESRGEGNVLTDRKAENGLVRGKSEAVDSGVVRQGFFLLEWERLELIWREDLLDFCKSVRSRVICVA